MLNRGNLAPGVAEKLKKRIQELVKKGDSRGPVHDIDEVDSLSSVSVKEAEDGGYSAKAARLAEGGGNKAVTNKAGKRRK